MPYALGLLEMQEIQRLAASKSAATLPSFYQGLEMLARLLLSLLSLLRSFLTNENGHFSLEIPSVLLKVYLYHLYSLPIPVSLVFGKSQIQIVIKPVVVKTHLF